MKIKNISAGSVDIESKPLEEDCSGNIGKMVFRDINIESKHPEEDCSGNIDKIHVRYINFDKYKIGFLENQNHEVVGIKSVEVSKKFYTDEQISKRFDYWDVEEYSE